MKKMVFQKKHIIALLSIMFAIINYLLCDSQVKHIFIINDSCRRLFVFLRLIAFVMSIFIFYSLMNKFSILIIWRRERRIYFFWIYLLLNTFILLLVWPGIYKGDEFYIIPSIVENLTIVWSQSWFTCRFYQICLMIYPILAVKSRIVCKFAFV